MTVEQATYNDIPQLIVLLNQLFKNDNTIESATKRCDYIFNNPDYRLLVAREEDKVIGSALVVKCVAFVENFLVVENVIVDENSRNKGVGAAIFNKVDELAAAWECDYTILVSSGFRKGAHVFYEKMGYVDDVRGFRKEYKQR